MAALNWFDWAILGVIALSTVVSLMRGFVKEALSLVGWFLAFIVARLFYIEFASLLVDVIETPSMRLIVAFGSLFLLTLLVCSLANHLLSALVKATGLGGFDRVLGTVFGALRGVIIVLVITGTLRMTPLVEDDWWQNSAFIPSFGRIETWARSTLGDPLERIDFQAL